MLDLANLAIPMAASATATSAATKFKAFFLVVVAIGFLFVAAKMLFGKRSGDLSGGARHLGVGFMALVMVAVAAGLGSYAAFVSGALKGFGIG